MDCHSLTADGPKRHLDLDIVLDITQLLGCVAVILSYVKPPYGAYIYMDDIHLQNGQISIHHAYSQQH
jgi:hypothetical protein